MSLAGGLNILLGRNGQGKSNFLESIYLLANARSFRSSSVRDVIRCGEESAEVSGTLVSMETPIDLKIRVDGNGRRLWVGKRYVRSSSEYLGTLKVAAFTPDDLAMVKGGPSLRRRFLDRAAFLFDPLHLLQVKQFESALRSRNRLLREKPAAQREVIESFSQAMADSGYQVSKMRGQALSRFGPRAEAAVARMLQGSGSVSISFRPGWVMDGSSGSASLLEQLRKNLDQDIRRGQTGLGPQQDDFDVTLGVGSARRFASQGQQRVIAVAVLLAVVEEMVDSGEEMPVLLLDDVSSELDGLRRKVLFDRLLGLGGQVLVTTTDKGLISDLVSRADRIYGVELGRLTAGVEV